MFGFKIISKSEYNRLITCSNDERKRLLDKGEVEKSRLRLQIKDLEEEKEKLVKENKECKQTIGRLKMFNNYLRAFKRDTLEALANIDLGSFRLQVCKSKCDTCDQEHTDCKKYSFGSLSFCVIPKQQPSKE